MSLTFTLLVYLRLVTVLTIVCIGALDCLTVHDLIDLRCIPMHKRQLLRCPKRHSRPHHLIWRAQRDCALSLFLGSQLKPLNRYLLFGVKLLSNVRKLMSDDDDNDSDDDDADDDRW